MKGWVRRAGVAFCWSVPLLLAASRAQAGGIEDFTLTKAVPADASVSIHVRHHEGQKFVDEQMARVWAEVEAARFDRDLKKIFKARAQGGTSVEEFDAQWQQVVDLFNGVEWSTLGEREYAMGLRMAPMPEFVCLMMPPKEKIEPNFEGLSNVVKTLVGLTGDSLALNTEEVEGATIHRVTAKQAQLPFALVLARYKDVLIVSVGSTMFEQSLALLRGQEGKSLAADERFKAAFADLPAPTDGMTFMDGAKFFAQLQAFVDQMMAMIPPEADEAEAAKLAQVKKLPGMFLNAFDMMEYSATTTQTEGMKSTTHSVTRMREDAASHAGYRFLFGNPPIQEPLRCIPSNAQNFMVNSGVDLVVLFDWVVKLLKEDVPEGEQALAGLEALKTETGLDLREDVLACFQGGMINFNLAGATQFSTGESAFFLKLRDEAKTKALIAKVIEKANAQLQQGEQPMGGIVAAEVAGAEGFHSLNLPQLAMFGIGKPTFGVKDGWLMIGSSPAVLETAIKTAAGEVEGMAGNERFKAEGVPVTGEVNQLSFEDLTRLGDQFGQMLSMVPMLGMMMGDAARDPNVQALMGMLGKAGRVARKLDFYQSSSSMGKFDGNVYRLTTVVHYRKPPEPAKPAENGEPESKP